MTPPFMYGIFPPFDELDLSEIINYSILRETTWSFINENIENL
jgi:hypothetical protein